MKKLLISMAFFLTAVLSLFSFDWPQNEILSDSFYSYFGQLRGGRISTSLVFSESNEVKAADSGHILTVITEHDEDDLFESTLGNAVIIQHKDHLSTVYANLDSDNTPLLTEKKDLEKGEFIANTSNSGWQEGEACLEFQVLDTKNETYVNPRVLMPRIGKELELTIKNITLKSRKGVEADLSTQKTITSGTYLVYRDRQEIAMPYKTSLFINGASVENLSYDILVNKDGRTCINGKKVYSVENVYPDSRKQLLGEVTIPKGRNTLTIMIADILGKEKQLTYTLEAR